MSQLLHVSSSPHVRARIKTEDIMKLLIITLEPLEGNTVLIEPWLHLIIILIQEF